ncbi:MAG: AraC family transcriptional regulator [Deinococcota bacterium]
MYNPVQDGIEKVVQSVQYVEVKPPNDLANVVHRFWELKTDAELAEDFHLHALPDACVNILLNQLDTRIAGITALRTTYTVLNLGKTFHYAGIQLLPGVWQGNKDEIADNFVGTAYQGDLPLIDTNQKLANLKFSAKQPVMAALVRQLADDKVIVPNAVTASILAHLDDIHSVADMAKVAGVSTRQLQRTLKRVTGFSPHDLLKVLRLQQSFKKHYLMSYADQAHYIRSFRNITGYTPAKYAKKFDV